MAFVRKKVKTFKWPVQVREPSEAKPGEFETSEFIAIFKREKMSKLQDSKDDENIDLIRKVLVGWEGIVDEDGEEVPFSDEVLEEQADDADWIKAVLNTYAQTYAEAEAGN
jgi:hypothetical protein|tara:strand:- start:346 stop:678 length:333 start_codon:yes stop_codon:yes gene_type:complete